MTMLRLTGKRTSRISNRLAIFAALLLVVTSLAGVGNSTLLTDSAQSAMASSANQKSQPARLRSNRFKVSLFLFRNNR
jgi:excinuclease UvrABC ATPase subunit